MSKKEIEEDQELEEILADVDVLLDKILDRLQNQSTIINVATKVRVVRLFIMQVATGGNKTYLLNEYKKIVKKIKAMEVVEEEALEPIPETGSKITKNRKTPALLVKMPATKGMKAKERALSKKGRKDEN